MKQHENQLKNIRAVLLLVVAATMLGTTGMSGAVVTPDTVTVATIPNGQAGAVVDVPVYIRDASSSPLGLDQPAGQHIQAYAIKVNYSPASAVSSITFTRGGITTALTPASESSPASAGSISLIDSFSETTNPIPFSLNGALPGNQVATLHVAVSGTAVPGTVITLTLDPSSLTQLSNDTGTTGEVTGNATLTLVNGSITVTPSVPAMSQIALLILAVSLAFIAIRSRF
jgi:hypothetical protein